MKPNVIILILVIVGILTLAWNLAEADRRKKSPNSEEVISQEVGLALFSSLGAYQRIHGYAKESGKAHYLKESKKQLALINDSILGWLDANSVDDEFRKNLEEKRNEAYKQIADNIENGENPLEYLD